MSVLLVVPRARDPGVTLLGHTLTRHGRSHTGTGQPSNYTHHNIILQHTHTHHPGSVNSSDNHSVIKANKAVHVLNYLMMFSKYKFHIV